MINSPLSKYRGLRKYSFGRDSLSRVLKRISFAQQEFTRISQKPKTQRKPGEAKVLMR